MEAARVFPGGEWAKLSSPSPTSVKEMGPPGAVHVDVDVDREGNVRVTDAASESRGSESGTPWKVG
jgi:hypothetical protein